MPALDGITEVHHGGQGAQGAFTSGRLGLVDDAFPNGVVLAGVEEAALRLQPVPSRPAALLLVVLQRLRHAGVDDVPHVRLVDPHTERHRRDDRLHLFVDERFLVAATYFVGEAGVVG